MISDDEWERTHPTWKALEPWQSFNGFNDQDETEADYSSRVGVPLEVAEQWLHGLYFEWHTVNNYGWIDYSRAIFERQAWPTARLVAVNVIEDFRESVENRARGVGFESFCCVREDLRHWRTHGTWRVPPIVLDAEGFGPPPSWAEVGARYQLVEGHNRSGYLRCLDRVREPCLAPTHDVYVLRRQ